MQPAEVARAARISQKAVLESNLIRLVSYMVTIYLYSLLISAVSVFYDYCLQKHGIFHQLYRWIESRLWYGLIRENSKFIRPQWSRLKRRHLVPQWKRYLYHITGGCVFCTNPYISLFFWVFLFGFFSLKLVFYYVFHISLNHILLRIWYTLSN